jgi:hypothetical protein
MEQGGRTATGTIACAAPQQCIKTFKQLNDILAMWLSDPALCCKAATAGGVEPP